ncbi:CD109 antigen isoform X1 [Oncorhynchus tshawytscha]|nr:CD109 antigen isoform X1 [Oncorhynchus tshawytscha]
MLNLLFVIKQLKHCCGFFSEGVTGVLDLPPFPESSVDQRYSFKLHVWGYQRERLVFINTTTLRFNPRTFSTFIQTDKHNYRPGDTVKMRVLSVQPDGKPHKGRVYVSIRDPKGNLIQGWPSLNSYLGVVSKEFHLSQTTPLGIWTIETMVDELTTEEQFIVDYYEPPHFDVQVKTAPDIVMVDDLSGTVTAQHTNGQPVKGTLSVTVTLVSALFNSGRPTIVHNATKDIHGSTQFLISQDDPPVRQHRATDLSNSQHHTNGILYITACVTEMSTGLKTNKTVVVHVMENTYHLEFYNFPHVLKPSLNFSTHLKISRYDNDTLTPEDRINSVFIDIGHRTSYPIGQNQGETNSDSPQDKMEDIKSYRRLTLPVPEDGIVHIEFQLRKQVEMLFIQAMFMGSEESLELYNTNHSSPSGSYIQIQRLRSPPQIGKPLPISVGSTFQLTELHYLVTSRGQVVAAGTATSPSFSLSPAVSWSPEACITVFCVLPDGEIINDSMHVFIKPHGVLQNEVYLSWSHEKVMPGEEVSLTVLVIEPGSLVGIMVVDMGDKDSDSGDITEEKVLAEMTEYLKEEITLHDSGITGGNDSPISVFTACNLVVLTDASLHTTGDYQETEMDHEAEALMREDQPEWRPSMGQDFSKTWLWLDMNISESTTTSFHVAVPDSITSWRAMAFVMSDNLGLGLTFKPQKLIVSTDFSLSLDVPECITRGEQLVLEVNLFNHLEEDTEVIVVVAESSRFEFVLADRDLVSMVNARRVTVGSQGGATALFPIRPLVFGEILMSVKAMTGQATEKIVRKVLVKPEGKEQSYSETMFLEVVPTNHNLSRQLHFSFPPDVVPGSERVHVAVVGDILGLSITGLGLLVKMPLGCGEQNMINFVPNVYVLQRLAKSIQPYEEIRSKALSYMMEGYQRQLSFQRDDGSFSAFGASDTSGSTWLTAFVLRCFLQARSFMQIDQSVLTKAMGWLVQQQGSQGEFIEMGRVIHTELQGGLDGPVSLTSYVLVTLLEDQAYVSMFPGNESLTRSYLEGEVASGVSSNYSLCLAAYALSLANSLTAGTALDELKRRADIRDGVQTWRSSSAEVSDSWQPRSAEIEMAAYVLLALYKRASVVEAISLMKWLSQQRNHLGAYGSTQDTVVALQALSVYAAFSGADAIELGVEVSTSVSPTVSHFNINSTNYLVHQSKEVDAEQDLLINVFMEGRGFALFQMNVFYNIEDRVLSERSHDDTDHEGFSLEVEVLDDEDDLDHIMLSICTRLLESQKIAQTGMVLVDVGVLSGFTLAPQAVATGDLVRKVEASPGKVSLYLDSLTTTQVCIRIPMIRNFKVSRVHDAVVQVYDYYEPRRKAVRSYNSDVMQDMGSCAFCGRDCGLCRQEIIISSSSTAHTRNTAIYWLGCVLIAITALLL